MSEKNPDYKRIDESNPMFDYVEARKSEGLPVCDSEDHNVGCTNPTCPVWGDESGTVRHGLAESGTVRQS